MPVFKHLKYDMKIFKELIVGLYYERGIAVVRGGGIEGSVVLAEHY